MARRYHYRGPFDPQLLEDIENPYRLSLLIAEMERGDPDDQKLTTMAKYIKSLLNVHGVAVCRSMGAKVEKIFAEDEEQEVHDGRPVMRTVTMPNGTVIKVLGK